MIDLKESESPIEFTGRLTHIYFMDCRDCKENVWLGSTVPDSEPEIFITLLKSHGWIPHELPYIWICPKCRGIAEVVKEWNTLTESGEFTGRLKNGDFSRCTGCRAPIFLGSTSPDFVDYTGLKRLHGWAYKFDEFDSGSWVCPECRRRLHD